MSPPSGHSRADCLPLACIWRGARHIRSPVLIAGSRRLSLARLHLLLREHLSVGSNCPVLRRRFYGKPKEFLQEYIFKYYTNEAKTSFATPQSRWSAAGVYPPFR
jgi:hypothetical protein